MATTSYRLRLKRKGGFRFERHVVRDAASAGGPRGIPVLAAPSPPSRPTGMAEAVEQPVYDERVVKVPDPEHRVVLGALAKQRGLDLLASGGSRKTFVLRGEAGAIDRVLQETRRLGLELSVARIRSLADLLERNSLPVPPELADALGVAEAALAEASGGHDGHVQKSQAAGVEPARPA